jgi:hypothetical protein
MIPFRRGRCRACYIQRCAAEFSARSTQRRRAATRTPSGRQRGDGRARVLSQRGCSILCLSRKSCYTPVCDAVRPGPKPVSFLCLSRKSCYRNHRLRRKSESPRVSILCLSRKSCYRPLWRRCEATTYESVYVDSPRRSEKHLSRGGFCLSKKTASACVAMVYSRLRGLSGPEGRSEVLWAAASYDKARGIGCQGRLATTRNLSVIASRHGASGGRGKGSERVLSGGNLPGTGSQSRGNRCAHSPR